MHESARRPSNPAPTTLDPWLDANQREARRHRGRELRIGYAALVVAIALGALLLLFAHQPVPPV